MGLPQLIWDHTGALQCVSVAPGRGCWGCQECPCTSSRCLLSATSDRRAMRHTALRYSPKAPAPSWEGSAAMKAPLLEATWSPGAPLCSPFRACLSCPPGEEPSAPFPPPLIHFCDLQVLEATHSGWPSWESSHPSLHRGTMCYLPSGSLKVKVMNLLATMNMKITQKQAANRSHCWCMLSNVSPFHGSSWKTQERCF